jgi:NADH:ubiquinone oxidoreductase subunit 5 (subunit L)/multisubunit Na+/H+ antiporter MnhA subunit
MAAGSLLAVAYVVRVLTWAFLSVDHSAYPNMPWVMKWPPLALSVVALLLGLAAYEPVLLSLTASPVAGVLLQGVGP